MGRKPGSIRGFRFNLSQVERLQRLAEGCDLSQSAAVLTMIPPDGWVDVVAAEVRQTGSDNIFEALAPLLAYGLRQRMQEANVAAYGQALLEQLTPAGTLEAYRAFEQAIHAQATDAESPKYRLEAFPDEATWAAQGLAGKLCILYRQERLTATGIEFVMVDDETEDAK